MNGSNSNTSGDSVAVLAFSDQSGSDHIPKAITDELARRSIITLSTTDLGNTVFSPTEPQDKTKVWWKTNAITGIPEGNALVWSEADNAWVPSNTSSTPYTPPKEQFISLDAVAGASTRNITVEDMGRDDYFVQAEISTRVAGVWNSAPANTNNFGWCVINKTATSLSLALFAVPTGGLNFNLRLRNPE